MTVHGKIQIPKFLQKFYQNLARNVLKKVTPLIVMPSPIFWRFYRKRCGKPVLSGVALIITYKNIFKCDFKRVLSHSVNTRTSLPQTQLFKTENWHRFPSTAMFLFSLSLVLVIIVIISTLFVLKLGVPLGHSKVIISDFWLYFVCTLVQFILWEVANFLAKRSFLLPIIMYTIALILV